MANEYLGARACRRSMRLPSSLEALQYRAATVFGADQRSVELWLDAGAQGRRGRGTIQVVSEDQYKQIQEDDVIVVVVEGKRVDLVDLSHLYESTAHRDFVAHSPQERRKPTDCARTSVRIADNNAKFLANTSYRDDFAPSSYRQHRPPAPQKEPQRPASVSSTTRPASVCSSRPAPRLRAEPAPFEAAGDRRTGKSSYQDTFKKFPEPRYKSISEIEGLARPETPQPSSVSYKAQKRQIHSWRPTETEYSAKFPSHPITSPPARRISEWARPQSQMDHDCWRPAGRKLTPRSSGAATPVEPTQVFYPRTPPQRPIKPPPDAEYVLGDRLTGRTHYQDTFVPLPLPSVEPPDPHVPQEAWAAPKPKNGPFVHLEPYVGTVVIG